MNSLTIQPLKYDFSICKLIDFSKVKLDSEYCFIGKTDEENSLLCLTSDLPYNTKVVDNGWKGFKIDGVLEFSLIGILSGISDILAKNKIGIFAVSTYNTDYIFVKKENFEKALITLEKNGYIINKSV